LLLLLASSSLPLQKLSHIAPVAAAAAADADVSDDFVVAAAAAASAAAADNCAVAAAAAAADASDSIDVRPTDGKQKNVLAETKCCQVANESCTYAQLAPSLAISYSSHNPAPSLAPLTPLTP